MSKYILPTARVFTARGRTKAQKAFNPQNSELGTRVVRGAAFTLLGVLFRTAITVGSMAVLARLLTPADFGRLAMATVITELAAVFANFGFGTILIQRLRISRIQMDTMHWCAMVLGVVLTIIVFGLSFVTPWLFGDAVVGDLLKVLCLSFILEELTMVPRALMARRMLFQQDFYVQSGMLIVRAGTAIGFALSGWGIWSLAAGALAGLAFQTIAYQVLAGYWPRWRFSLFFLKSTWLTNGGHFGNALLFYVNSNLDFFLVGKTLGATVLGQYQNARSLTDEVRVRMAQPLQKVLFPAFSAIQLDASRFRDGVLKSGRLLALTFMPVGFGLAAVSPELVPLLYGDQWLSMIPILQIIALPVGFVASSTITSPIFNATNRVGLSFRLFCVSTTFTAIFMYLGSQWGLMGIAWSRVLLALVGLVFFRIAIGIIGMEWRHLWLILARPFLVSVAMWGLLVLTRDWLQPLNLAVQTMLLILVCLGIFFYIMLSAIFAPIHTQCAREVLLRLRR